MSHTYYNELWLIARNDLEKLLELDQRLQQQSRTNDREQGLNLILPLYLRYRNLVKRLIVCYDQMLQTQKRELIRRVLDCAVARMLEYKREITNINYNDYQWPDNFMNQLKYTPDDVEVFISAMGKEVVEQRRKQFEEMAQDAQKPEEINEETVAIADDAEEEVQEDSPRMRRRKVREKSVEDDQTVPAFLWEPPEVVAAREARLAKEEAMQNAILLIQSHERARIGRRNGAEVKRIYDINKKVLLGVLVPKNISRLAYNKAAATIQRAWWIYTAKKQLRQRINKMEELLGMTIPSWKCDAVHLKDKENFHKRLEMIPSIFPKIAQVEEEERARLWKIQGPGLIEDITDEIREWFLIWYDNAGHFDVYPAASLGGSVLIATGQTLTPQEYLATKASQSEKGKQGKDSKGAAKGAKGGKKSQHKPWIDETRAFNGLEDGNRDFIHNWSFRDDFYDPPNKVYRDLIKNELCYELQLEMRKIVDELMKLELKRLNAALKKDYKADEKDINIPKQKGERKKKKKGKKKKDGLGKLTSQDIFKELSTAGIIKNIPLTPLKDWRGDLSYQNHEAAIEFRDYYHRLGEIRQVIMEYCILPLSSKGIHQMAPLIRSVCICGFPGYGKTFLISAICSEVGALMINMSPSELIDKYTGKRKEKKLISMINKVARDFAPSVIVIKDAEMVWAKKVPIEHRYLMPKRFAKHYKKLVKGIKKGDQILFLTTSAEPHKAKGPFVKIHDKFIMIPQTDYGTLYMFYKELLMQYHGVDRDIDVSSLAKMSVGVPLNYIRECVDRVLNLRRRITLRFKPLFPSEIYEEVKKYEKPKPKVIQALNKFEKRTPMGKNKTKLIAIQKLEQERLMKLQAKKENFFCIQFSAVKTLHWTKRMEMETETCPAKRGTKLRDKAAVLFPSMKNTYILSNEGRKSPSFPRKIGEVKFSFFSFLLSIVN